MDMRNDFLLQLLQKLGAPLMKAVNAHSSGNQQADAKTLATLLSECVKISISLSQSMNLKVDDGDANAIRVSLASLAAGLVADSYAQKGRYPGDAESQKITTLLQSVIVFADHFAPAQEHASRLKTLDSTPPFFDPVQTNIYAMHALIPVISAIAEFSFGQPETKLVQDVAERLRTVTKDFLAKLPLGGNGMDELVVMQALGQIYQSSHRAQTYRLQQTGGEGVSPSLNDVWAGFDLQVAMLEVLVGGMSSENGVTGSSGGGIRPVAPPAESPPEQVAPVSDPSSTQSAAAGGSPMSFFKKK